MDSVNNNRFPKSERIKSKRLIEKLFSKGASFISYPFRVLYLEQEDDKPTQFAISVPKKKIKTAVQRNRIKRLTREAYRLNKLKTGPDLPSYALFFIYLDKDEKSYKNVEAAVVKALNKIDQKNGQ